MPVCHTCAMPYKSGSRFCGRCGSALPHPRVRVAASPTAVWRPSLEGIGGWLVLLACGLALVPLVVTRTILITDIPIAFGHGNRATHLVGIAFVIKNLINLAALIL